MVGVYQPQVDLQIPRIAPPHMDPKLAWQQGSGLGLIGEAISKWAAAENAAQRQIRLGNALNGALRELDNARFGARQGQGAGDAIGTHFADAADRVSADAPQEVIPPDAGDE